eukprot:11329804-Ditylum_brightwellii.AAC.1
MPDDANAMPTADSSVQGGATGTNQSRRSNTGTSSSQGSRSNTNNQSSNGTQNNNTHGNNRRTILHTDTSNRNFVGKNKEVGVVLGVPYKVIDKMVPFGMFREATSNYIVNEFKGGSNVVHIVRELWE